MARARANKKLKKAQELMGQYHVSLVVPNQKIFTVGWVFSQVNQLFVADNMDAGNVCTTYES